MANGGLAREVLEIRLSLAEAKAKQPTHPNLSFGNRKKMAGEKNILWGSGLRKGEESSSCVETQIYNGRRHKTMQAYIYVYVSFLYTHTHTYIYLHIYVHIYIYIRRDSLSTHE